MEAGDSPTGGTEPLAAAPASPEAPPAGPAWAREPRRILAFEVLAVLGVGWFWTYFGWAADLIWPEAFARPYPYWYSWLYTMVYNLPLMALVLVIARRGGDSWRELGIVKPRWLVDGLIVLGCFVGDELARIGYALYVDPFLNGAFARPDDSWWKLHFPRPAGALQWSAWPVDILVATTAEELLMRAYLLPRLERLLGSDWEAILLGAALFGAGHLYQGVENAILCGIFGAVYGFIFLATRRIWPLAAAHTLNNAFVFLRHWLGEASP